MVEGLRQLLILQRLDDDLVSAEQESETLPARRQDQAERRAAAEAECEQARQALSDAEGGQRRLETQAQDHQALLQRLEGQQFQVKSNAVYTTLLREIDQAKEAISDAETQVLESMEAIDAARVRVAGAEQQTEATLANVAQAKRGLDDREGVLRTSITDLRKRRDELCGEIEAELLAQYRRIGSRKRPAVALVREETCLGCRVKIPPQLHIELLRGDSLTTCARCHRILIHPRTIEAAK